MEFIGKVMWETVNGIGLFKPAETLTQGDNRGSDGKERELLCSLTKRAQMVNLTRSKCKLDDQLSIFKLRVPPRYVM